MPTKQQEDRESTTKRVVKMLSATYFEPTTSYTGEKTAIVRTAGRGEEIELTAAEERRLDDLGALLPEGSDPADAQRIQEAIQDAYRAERGDRDALARHQERLAAAYPKDRAGGIVRIDAPIESGAGELSAWIREEQPSSDETVALAEGDPERARVVLEAEQTATGGSPRPEVAEGLEKIIAGG